MLRTRSAFILAAIFSLLLAALQRSTPASAPLSGGATGPSVPLKIRLEKGLRAMRPAEFQFLHVVEKRVREKKLPTDIVNSAFLWAVQKTDYRVQFFEQALRQLAQAQGIPFDTHGVSSFNPGFNTPFGDPPQRKNPASKISRLVSNLKPRRITIDFKLPIVIHERRGN